MNERQKKDTSLWTVLVIWILIPAYWWWNMISITKVQEVLIEFDLFNSLNWHLAYSVISASNLYTYLFVLYQFLEWDTPLNERPGFFRFIANASQDFLPFWLWAGLIGNIFLGYTHFSGNNNIMSPTIQGGDKVVWTSIAYLMNKPERGDIVVLQTKNGFWWPGRIVGLPGENFQLMNKNLVINGQILPETYLSDYNYNITNCLRTTTDKYYLDNDEYQILLDCPTSKQFLGARVKREDILGKVFMRYWPDKFGLLPDVNYSIEVPPETTTYTYSWIDIGVLGLFILVSFLITIGGQESFIGKDRTIYLYTFGTGGLLYTILIWLYIITIINLTIKWWVLVMWGISIVFVFIINRSSLKDNRLFVIIFLGAFFVVLLPLTPCIIFVIPFYLLKWIFGENKVAYHQYYYNAGTTHFNQNEHRKAIAKYTKSIELKSNNANVYNDRGFAYIRTGDYDKAIADCNKAIELVPTHAEAHHTRGLAYTWQNNFSKAFIDYNKAFELGFETEEVYSDQGLAYIRQGNYDQAITHLTKAIELNPKDVYSYIRLGIAHRRQDNYTQAIFYYTKAIDLDSDPQWYINRGWAYIQQGNYDEARANITKAIKINPNFGRAYAQKGYIHLKQGNLSQAMVACMKAVKLAPNDSAGYSCRGHIYFKQSNDTLAFADYTKAIELEPNESEGYNDRGFAYARRGKYEQAMNDCLKAMELNPNYAEVYDSRGFVYAKQGDYSNALADFDHAIELRPHYAIAYTHRGIVHYEQGNNNQALADFEKAMEFRPKYPDPYYYRGLIRYQQEHYIQAIDDFNQADSPAINEVEPSELYKARGLAFSKIEQFEQAITDFTQVIKLTTPDAELYNERGLAHYELGNYDQAIADYTESIRLDPQDAAMVYYNRGIVYEELEQKDEAIADFRKVVEINGDSEAIAQLQELGVEL